PWRTQRSTLFPYTTPFRSVIGEAGPVGGHGVFGGDGAHGDGVAVGAEVAHHADGLGAGEHGEGLPEVAVEAGALDLVHNDPVGGDRKSTRLNSSHVAISYA